MKGYIENFPECFGCHMNMFPDFNDLPVPKNYKGLLTCPICKNIFYVESDDNCVHVYYFADSLIKDALSLNQNTFN